jgi:hypothetical protein
MTAMRRAPQRVEIVCPTCGLIAEIARPRGGTTLKLCACPGPRSATAATKPRLCVTCSTRLNRYNTGIICGPCARTRERDDARAEIAPR